VKFSARCGAHSKGNADSLKDQTYFPVLRAKNPQRTIGRSTHRRRTLRQDLRAPVERKLNRTYEGTHYGLPLLAAVFTGEHRVLGSIGINHGKYFISFGARKRRIPE
jgi:hypothetical protein